MSTYAFNDIRNCRNCQQPIYFGGLHWWHRHNESGFCHKDGADTLSAEPELDATERIRAAAPDLLEALKYFVEDPRFVVTVGGNPNAVAKMFAQCRAAIAKAVTP